MEKGSGANSWGIAILLLQITANAFGSVPAADPLATALEQGDMRSAYRLILTDENGSQIAPVFYQLAKQSESDPALKARLGNVAFAFDTRLRKELSPLAFAAYRRCAADTGLNEVDRMRLILPMIEGIPRLRPLQRDTLKSLLKGILASRFPARMKAALLTRASRFPSNGLDGNAILPFFRSQDTTIRKAALQALIRVIIRNRDQRLPSLNQALFDSLKGNATHVPDRYEALAMASIGEDYARDHLLSRCGTDAVKLAVIIRHDPYLRHVGLAYAALGFPKSTPQGAALRDALRYGLKDADWVANQIASKPYSDSAKAEDLRKTMSPQTTVSR